ncbi:MAG: hypothetical protein J5365_03855 [Erysipelotrichaceae bacterium]|nr:hypothetical protein [Erysipelotrichaceae bacterium]
MKKILILLCVIMLVACSSKGLSWNDVKDRYDELSQTIENAADLSDTFLQDDYKKILNSALDSIEQLKSGVSKDDEQTAENLYKIAEGLEKITGLFSSDSSGQLALLAEEIKELVAAAYDKAPDFEQLKEKVRNDIDAILNWSSQQWLSVEKRQTLKWEDVADDYDVLYEDTVRSLKRARDVTEEDLIELKDVILNNYEQILYGIDKEKRETADQIYAAAVSLKEYTEDLKGNAAEKVNRFAGQAIEYVESVYGKTVEDPDFDFLKEVESAGKWTLSLFNEITTQMKR